MATDKTAELQHEYESLWIEWLALELDDPKGDAIMQRISDLQSLLGIDDWRSHKRARQGIRQYKWETVLDPGPNYRGPDRTPSGQRVWMRPDRYQAEPPIKPRAKTKLTIVS
jgi:hypothetical protein